MRRGAPDREMPRRESPADGHRSGSSFITGFVSLLLIAGVLFGLGRLTLGSPGADRPEVTAELGVLADPGDTYDPVKAGEDLPAGFRQLLRRDAILPIYDPSFVRYEQVDWSDDTLVIGIAIDGEAKAYPISFLNRREMVIDSLAGIPLLVTW